MDKRIQAQIDEMIWHEENVLKKTPDYRKLKKVESFQSLMN